MTSFFSISLQRTETESSLAHHLRTLLKDSGIYMLSSLASPFVSLVLAPFLTRVLSPHDYGTLAVLSTAIALMTGVTQIGLSNAFFYAYNYDYKTRCDRLSVLSTTIVLLSLISIPIVIIIFMTAPWLAVLLFNSTSLRDAVRGAALAILLQNFAMPGLAWLRAENRALFYSTLSILSLLINLIVTVILVGVFHLGINGAVLGTAAGYAVMTLCTLPIILWRAGVLPRFDVAVNLLSFGFPMVGSVVAVWVLQLSDRYLLSHFGSLAQTASYSVAYSLGGILGIVVLSPFSLSWPTAMFTIAKRDDAPLVFRLVFRWFTIILLSTAFAFSLAATLALNLFFPPVYHTAAPIIPLIAASLVFYGAYNIFVVGGSVQRKTWLSVIYTTVAALVNVALNIILIPLYGAMGAALSTLLAYALLALLAYIGNQYIYPISFEVGRFSLALLLGALFYAAGAFLARSQSMPMAWSIYLGTLILYIGFLVLSGKFAHGNTAQQVQKDSGAMKKGFPATPERTGREAVPIRICIHSLATVSTDPRTRREATALLEAGFVVTVVDVVGDRNSPVEEYMDGIHFRHIRNPNRFKPTRFKPWFLVKMVGMILVAVAQLWHVRADIYHAQVETALPACYIVSRLRRKPLIFDALELPLSSPIVKHWHLLHYFATLLLRMMVAHCAGVIAVSEPIVQEMQRRYPGPAVTLIRNVPTYRTVPASDRLHQHLGLAPNVQLALYQGNFQPNRALDVLVRCAPFLPPGIVIVLMGKDMVGTRRLLENLIAQLDVAERVKILPAVPYAELLDWTASADLGLTILPPKYSLSIRWCLPNKLFEYLMAGLPVLSSRLDAIMEILSTYQVGCVVDSEQPEQVAAAINTMLSDKEALAQMRANALRVAQQQFCWQQEQQHLLQLYQHIASAYQIGKEGQR